MTLRGPSDGDATVRPVAEIVHYLQEQVGPRIAAGIAGLAEAEQIASYARGTASPPATAERRLRAGYESVRMLVDAYGEQTARAWLFGTNVRLDDQAPIDVLGAARETSEFEAVMEAARESAGFEA